MYSHWITLSLESDVVVTAQWMTLGGHRSLDFIPGSALLGALAAAQGKDFDPALLLSGEVRLGNALPFHLDHGIGVPVPLNYHVVKAAKDEAVKQPWNQAASDNQQEATSKLSNALLITPEEWQNLTLNGIQLQQKREGYLACSERSATVAGLPASRRLQLLQPKQVFRLKTAINRDSFFRSKDEALFGYQAIQAGSMFCAELSAQDEHVLDQIIATLLDKPIRLGRSRTAEYGRVRVAVGEPPALPKPQPHPGDPTLLSLYLLSDLALSPDTQPCLNPTIDMFGIADFGALPLLPVHSFLRHRRYSPWIAFFQGHGMERQVLTQGSVLSFRLPEPLDAEQLTRLQSTMDKGAGLYRHEGLGRILINPGFLYEHDGTILAKAIGTRCKEEPVTQAGHASIDPLITVLERRSREAEAIHIVEQESLQWSLPLLELTKALKVAREDRPGKSQWGSVRQLATRYSLDTKALAAALQEFCTKSLRSKLWSTTARFKGEDQSLYQLLEQFIKKADPGLAGRILAATASRLQKVLAEEEL